MNYGKRNKLFFLINLMLFVLILTAKISFAECNKDEEIVRKGIENIFSFKITEGIKKMQGLSFFCETNYLSRYNLAIAYGMAGNYSEMENNLRKAINAHSDFYPAQINLAWALINNGNHEEALKMVNELENKKVTSATRLLKAFSYLYQKNMSRFDLARKDAIEVGLVEKKELFDYLDEIEKDSKASRFVKPRLNRLMVEKGRLYEKIGDFEKAKEYYLLSKERTGIIRLIALLKTLKAGEQEINVQVESLLDWKKKVTAPIDDAINYNTHGPFPEGVLTFIYPEALVEVPEGPFKIGEPNITKSDKNYFWNHDVYTDNFLIGKYEVTNIEYMIFVESTGYPSPVSTHDANYDLFEAGKYKGDIGLQPIVNVSWYDVNRYIKWKSAISGATYKLPTEERWEKTARGTDGRVFPWGNSLPDETIANYGKNWNDFEKKYITIKRVDDFEKGASPYGALNMAGNVWEWTSSTYKTFFYNDPTIAIESVEVIKNELKVIRGGSWINKAHELRSTFRNRTWPYIKYNGIGFRLVRNKEK